MKLKIPLATGLVLLAACSPQPTPADQAGSSQPDPAASSAGPSRGGAAANMPKVEDPELVTRDYPSVALGTTVSAAAPAAELTPMLISGWARPEAWGVWTDGTQARIGFKIDGEIDSDVDVAMQVKAFMGGSRKELTVSPTANGRPLAPIVFTGSQAEATLQVIRVSAADINEANGRVQLDFAIQDPQSPQQLGLSADERRLGIGLIELTVR